MSLVPSLLQAIVHLDGEALVMHAGDKPYVVSPMGQVELATRGLALDAINGILGQLLPEELQQALDEFGAVQYEIPSMPEFSGEHFTVVAARGGDDVWVEVRRRRIADEDRIPESFFTPQEEAAKAQPYPVYASVGSPDLPAPTALQADALDINEAVRGLEGFEVGGKDPHADFAVPADSFEPPAPVMAAAPEAVAAAPPPGAAIAPEPIPVPEPVLVAPVPEPVVIPEPVYVAPPEPVVVSEPVLEIAEPELLAPPPAELVVAPEPELTVPEPVLGVPPPAPVVAPEPIAVAQEPVREPVAEPVPEPIAPPEPQPIAAEMSPAAPPVEAPIAATLEVEDVAIELPTASTVWTAAEISLEETVEAVLPPASIEAEPITHESIAAQAPVIVEAVAQPPEIAMTAAPASEAASIEAAEHAIVSPEPPSAPDVAVPVAEEMPPIEAVATHVMPVEPAQMGFDTVVAVASLPDTAPPLAAVSATHTPVAASTFIEPEALALSEPEAAVSAAEEVAESAFTTPEPSVVEEVEEPAFATPAPSVVEEVAESEFTTPVLSAVEEVVEPAFTTPVPSAVEEVVEPAFTTPVPSAVEEVAEPAFTTPAPSAEVVEPAFTTSAPHEEVEASAVAASGSQSEEIVYALDEAELVSHVEPVSELEPALGIDDADSTTAHAPAFVVAEAVAPAVDALEEVKAVEPVRADAAPEPIQVVAPEDHAEDEPEYVAALLAEPVAAQPEPELEEVPEFVAAALSESEPVEVATPHEVAAVEPEPAPELEPEPVSAVSDVEPVAVAQAPVPEFAPVIARSFARHPEPEPALDVQPFPETETAIGAIALEPPAPSAVAASVPTQAEAFVPSDVETLEPIQAEAFVPGDVVAHGFDERPVARGEEKPHAAPPPTIAAVPPPSQPATVLPLARNPIRFEQQTLPSIGDPTMSGLDRLLRLSAARGASALYLSSEARASVRVDGELQVLEGEPILTSRDVESLLLTLMPERSHEALRTGAATEWICDIEDVGRVRCMSFRDHLGPGGVFRLMPTRSVSADQLALPRAVQNLAIEPEGLVLIAGPRSSGKRTLMAAFVDLINRSRRDHIITIEREINIVHGHGASFISQREVRGNDADVLTAARAALREDPDVLVIEDIRTAEVMTVALEAAASGHLVIGGFSAHTATAAVDRIIDLYAPEHRRQVQFALADSLRGVVVQALLRKQGGGRVPARELLLNTPAVSSVIAEGKTSQLPMAIEGGRRYGMMPLNDALVMLVQQGIVDGREAYRYASDRPGLLAFLKRQGVDTSFVEKLA